MKKIIVIIIAVVATCGLYVSCDKIEGTPYEVIQVENVDVEFPNVDPTTVYRKVLIEEFTGHRCTNCPAGHQILEQLQQQYGDTLVAVGIHYGVLAKPSGSMYSYDFRTPAGTEIGDSYSIEGIPSAVVNHEMKIGGWMRDQWATVIRDVDRTKVYAALQLINEYDATNQSVKANTKVTLLRDYDHPLRIILYLLEDGIVKPQKDGNQDIENYTHNHVLRSTLTDAFGYMLNDNYSEWKSGDEVTYAASISFDGTDWNPANCCVVAALFDPIDYEVLQVEKVDVISR
jgi:thiol-disulfide isomerase/thioredoxin